MPARPWQILWLGVFALGPVVVLYGAVGLSGIVSGALESLYRGTLDSLAPALPSQPTLAWEVLLGPYGLLSMVPIFLLWTIPLVFLYGFLLSLYQGSGLHRLVSNQLHPWLRGLGLSGWDLARLLSGLGCKVPLAARGARSCSPAGIHLLAFAVPCSYQMAASLSVVALKGLDGLVVPYLFYLGLAGTVYAWWFWGRLGYALPLPRGHVSLRVPDWRQAVGDAYRFLSDFSRQGAIHILGMAFVASLLKALGFLDAMGSLLDPLLALMGLPSGAGLALVASLLRKDGILLLGPVEMGPGALLLSLYLTGTLGPCLVTVFALGRSEGRVFVQVLLARQLLFALASAIPLVILSHLWR